MPANKKVGVSDIAKHAGVSIGTVSNYLNYPERASETLKTKISRAIADLGYVPKHSNGQIPASNATPVIGFVMTDIEHSLFTSIFEGAQEVCEDHGMQVVGLNALSDKQRQSDMVRLLIGMNVAGIILSTVEDSPEDVAAARAANLRGSNRFRRPVHRRRLRIRPDHRRNAGRRTPRRHHHRGHAVGRRRRQRTARPRRAHPRRHQRDRL